MGCDLSPNSLCQICDAGWSSPVARQAHNLKAAGSNPAPATNVIAPLSSRVLAAHLVTGLSLRIRKSPTIRPSSPQPGTRDPSMALGSRTNPWKSCARYTVSILALHAQPMSWGQSVAKSSASDSCVPRQAHRHPPLGVLRPVSVCFCQAPWLNAITYAYKSVPMCAAVKTRAVMPIDAQTACRFTPTRAAFPK